MELISQANKIIDKIKPAQIYQQRLVLKGQILHIDEAAIDLKNYSSIHIVGLGKAASHSVLKLSEILSPVVGKQLAKGLACTKYHHSVQSELFESFESSHPKPDSNSQKAAQKLLDYVGSLASDALLIVCLSGGASSLAVKPLEPLDLVFKQQLTGELLSNGAAIEEINKIRRELSMIKNGGLAAASSAKRVVVLAISDIPSGQISMIGSGPCFYEKTALEELVAISKSYLSPELNQRFELFLNSCEHLNFLKAKEQLLSEKEVTHHLICDFPILMDTARKSLEKATQKEVVVVDSPLVGNIEEGIIDHLDRIKLLLNNGGFLISGGEYTVNVTGNGVGGRNLEFVLLLAKRIFWDNELKLSDDTLKKISFLSVGTDGTDGMTEAAGSFMNYDYYLKAKSLGLDIVKYLENNDSFNFFDKIGSVINTGATQTNVMDLRIVQVGEF